MKKTVFAIFAAIMITSCGQTETQRKANELLDRATEFYDQKKYKEALAEIDSLRKLYPSAVEVRKKALELYQNVSLSQAQDALAKTDSMLLIMNKVYGDMKQAVDKAKAELKATPEQLTELTLTKLKLDSLQTAFETQCQTIKYIHKKQKEKN